MVFVFLNVVSVPNIENVSFILVFEIVFSLYMRLKWFFSNNNWNLYFFELKMSFDSLWCIDSSFKCSWWPGHVQKWDLHFFWWLKKWLSTPCGALILLLNAHGDPYMLMVTLGGHHEHLKSFQITAHTMKLIDFFFLSWGRGSPWAFKINEHLA